MRYCKNCKYCKYREFASLGVNWGWFCTLKDKIVIDGIGNRTIYFDEKEGDCTKLNFKYDCPYYKRKWWKFWVKGD